jgi:hypothetical protein
VNRTPFRRALRATSLALTPALLLATVFVGQPTADVGASSHREAPLIAVDPEADTTDVYAFISPDRNDAVTLVANYIPLQAAYGGPNYYKFSDDVLYAINIDNVGDSQAHVSYQFRFSTTTRNPNTFLYNTNTITVGTAANPYPALNVVQTFTVTEVVDPTSGPTVTRTLGTGLLTPPVNVGGKSTPDYDALVAPALHTIKIGSGGLDATGSDNGAPDANDIRVFAGQRDDPFFVDLSSVFDLLSLRPNNPPIGYPEGPTVGADGLRYANVHSLVIQVPISRLVGTGAETVFDNQDESVLGVWSTASRQTQTVIGALNSRTSSGDFVQVSRLGMPLVNEAVIPRALKDAFNSIPPSVDFPLYTSAVPGLEAAGALLNQSVLTPELQTLLGALYGVPNPGKPRLDIQEIFLQGITTAVPFTVTAGTTPTGLPANFVVNAPTKAGSAIVPSEMLRINTAPTFRPGGSGSACKTEPDYDLGLLGGDACGFPNGRRLADDVTDIELLAVAGAAFGVTTGDTSFSMNPALIGVLDDGVRRNDKPFLTSFPYVASPWGGKEVGDIYINKRWFNIIARNTATLQRELRAE